MKCLNSIFMHIPLTLLHFAQVTSAHSSGYGTTPHVPASSYTDGLMTMAGTSVCAILDGRVFWVTMSSTYFLMCVSSISRFCVHRWLPPFWQVKLPLCGSFSVKDGMLRFVKVVFTCVLSCTVVLCDL